MIYGATRRWQCDYLNIKYSNRNSNKKRKKLISWFKSFPFFPPISIYHTFKLLNKEYVYSFAPALPLYIGHTVALENYDSLYDYNSLKRFIYEPLILLILFFSKGKFEFYSRCSKKSLKNNFFTKKIIARSNIVNFFKIKKYVKGNKNISKDNIICFVGDFYLKGGLELINAAQRIDIIKKYKIILMIPKKQIKRVTEVLRNNKLSPNIILKEIDEYNPVEYYQVLEKAKIYIHPTFYDSHAISAKEAKQLGCKTIVTDIFDSASEADIMINPSKLFFKNYRLKIPYSGQWIISKYSSEKRKIDIKISKQIETSLKELLK